jgi:hypothetical protein
MRTPVLIALATLALAAASCGYDHSPGWAPDAGVDTEGPQQPGPGPGEQLPVPDAGKPEADGGVAGRPCTLAAECDDNNPCTQDVCTAEGLCAWEDPGPISCRVGLQTGCCSMQACCVGPLCC